MRKTLNGYDLLKVRNKDQLTYTSFLKKDDIDFDLLIWVRDSRDHSQENN